MDATLHPALAAENCAFFKHRPLDHSEPSIRLVYLLPSLSPKDDIQCSITHATVDAKYTCLSYRWGDPSPSHNILIDGKPFTIGQNLFDFLTTARDKAASDGPTALGPYWIDALCIDQSNVLERNHQVRQMGSIYAGAKQVNVWLRLVPPDLLAFVPMLKKDEEVSPSEWEFVYSNVLDLPVQYIFDNEYWTRAWIIQEIFLARHVILWLGTASIKLEDMKHGLERFPFLTEDLRSQHFSQIAGKRKRLEMKGKSLVYLLNHFRDKQCSDPCDRIYSLLSLVTGNGRDLKVDYQISRVELAAEVLRQCQGSLCVCTAKLVVQTLELEKTDLVDSYPDHRSLPYLEFCTQDLYVSTYDSSIARVPMGNGLDFSNTCHASAFSPQVLHRNLAHWNNAGYSPQALVREDHVAFRPVEGWEDICIVRISLPFLATMKDLSVDMCAYAKKGHVRRGIPTGYPRICYAADTMEQPESAEPSSLPSSWKRFLEDTVEVTSKRRKRLLE